MRTLAGASGFRWIDAYALDCGRDAERQGGGAEEGKEYGGCFHGDRRSEGGDGGAPSCGERRHLGGCIRHPAECMRMRSRWIAPFPRHPMTIAGASGFRWGDTWALHCGRMPQAAGGTPALPAVRAIPCTLGSAGTMAFLGCRAVFPTPRTGVHVRGRLGRSGLADPRARSLVPPFHAFAASRTGEGGFRLCRGMACGWQVAGSLCGLADVSGRCLPRAHE